MYKWFSIYKWKKWENKLDSRARGTIENHRSMGDKNGKERGRGEAKGKGEGTVPPPTSTPEPDSYACFLRFI